MDYLCSKSLKAHMKKIFILIFLGCIQLIQAQVTVNQYPVVGTKFVLHYLQDSSIVFSKQIRPEGGNQTWDFSQLTEVEFVDTVKYLNPNDIPNITPLVGSNLVIEDNNSELSNLTYYKVTPTEQKALGLTFDDEKAEKFDTEFLTNKFPLNENDEIDDMTTITTTIEGVGKVKFEINNFGKVDGWGEIKTSKGTYPCLRMKSSTTTEGFLFGTPLFNSTNIEYKWMSPNFQYDVFKYVVYEAEFGPDLTNDTSAILLDQQITAVKEVIKSERIELLVSPNPTQDEVNIIIPESFSEQSKIEIFNEQSIISYNAEINSRQLKINVSQWPRGAYLIKVNDKNNQWTLKKLILK